MRRNAPPPPPPTSPYLQDLAAALHDEHRHLHIPGHTLASFLKLSPFYGDVQIVPHFT